MTDLLHTTQLDSDPRRTVCGLKLERGVHRVAAEWAQSHVNGRGAVLCPTCASRLPPLGVSR